VASDPGVCYVSRIMSCSTLLPRSLIRLIGPLLFLAGLPVAAAQPRSPDFAATASEALATLQQYIRIDTTNPPSDTRKTAAMLTQILEREGLKVTHYESVPGKEIILTRLAATVKQPVGKPILLLHHMDVVPADASRWKVPPFGAVVQDGLIWGRGAIDMKGLGVAHLYAFLLLKRLGLPRNRDVIFMAVPDEEAGGNLGARWMIAHHYAELDPEYVLDEGGVGSRDLYAKGKLVYGISVAQKKMLWLKLRAEGVAGHGSQPHDQNPNDRLVRALARLLAEPMPAASSTVLEQLKQRVGELAANKYTNAIQHSTVALTTLRAGVGEPPKVNVIPSVAEAGLDCRVLPGVTREQWLTELRRRLADPSLKIEIVYESDDPVVSPFATPLFAALEAAIHRQHADAVVTPILVPFGTDSDSFRARGVKSYGVFPALLTADIMASMHGDSERLPVAELGAAVRILFEALRDTLAP